MSFRPLLPLLRRLPVAALVVLLATGCGPPSDEPTVVVYASVDEAYSRPICRQFEQDTGVRVKLVTDTEAAKSSTLVTRLLMERGQPQADLFWSGDLMRALALAEQGLAERLEPAPVAPALGALNQVQFETGVQCGPGRLRVILYHQTAANAAGPLPQRVQDLAEPRFASKSCLANPLFGTTSVHAAALLQVLGDAGARTFFSSFAANGGRLLASNGEVKRRVASGEFAYGLTDSDDVHVALLDGAPVGFIVPDQADNGAGAVLIPSAVMRVQGGPHPRPAADLARHLASAQTARWLAESSGAHFPLDDLEAAPGNLGVRLAGLRLMPLDYLRLAREFDTWRSSFLEGWVRAMQD